ncbi:hypothetical protein B0H13DRAFT_2366390 [Mycena leptocephala]|nr:hypothetical protein B0H13DRAFT_2366390 [Mycena leptocephala]
MAPPAPHIAPVPGPIVSAKASSIAGNCGWKHYKEHAILSQSSLDHIPVVEALSNKYVLQALCLCHFGAHYPCCRHAQRLSPPPVTPPTSPQCCASVVPASSAAASAVAALVGLDLTGVLVDVGLSCSPITVIGNNCGSTTVTCDAPEKEWGGLIAINCIPITL